ncbi:MAG: PAS domain S-box protein, partial [Maioricimonas sp. JB049]
MPGFLFWLFDTTGFPARWTCGTAWGQEPWLAWTHIVADVATSLAYFSVPCVVMYFVSRREELRFPVIFYVFLGLIFFSCGTVHLTESLIFWWPVYRFSGMAKLVTAVVSCAGVGVLIRVLPDALQLQSPEVVKREVSDRKLAQASLESERNLLHTLMNTLPDAIYFKDRAGRFLRVSRALAEKFGLDSPADAVGRSDADFFSEEHVLQARRDEQNILDTGEPMVGVVERETWPDGRETWVTTTKAPLHNRAGERIGTFGISHDITEIKLAERALRISEERFELAVRGSSDGLWDWDLTGESVYYSERFKELLGYAGNEFANDIATLRDHVHPDDRQRTFEAIDQHLKDHQPYDVEYRLRTRSGEYRWFRARAQAVWNETGQPTRMAGSITDITEVKRTQNLLEHERFLLHTLLEHLPDAIYFKDAEGRFLRISQTLADWLGLEHAEDAVGRTIGDFLSSKVAHQTLEEERQVMRTERPLTGKVEQVDRREGESIWVSTTKVPLPDEQGRIVGTIGISHDITSQKEAEERFRLVVEAAPNPMLVINHNGRIDLVNSETERSFGYTREELIGQPIELLVPEPLRQQHEEDRNEYMLSPIVRDKQLQRNLSARRRDGTEFPVEVGLSPLVLGDETVVLSSVYDITERMQVETVLRAAKESAEAANRAKSDFLANMSHEIRTPMNAIIGMTDLVLDTDLTPTQQDYLTTVLEAAEALLSIINEILDFSKIEAGKLELHCQAIDLREEVGDTLKSLGLRAHNKGVELAWHVHSNVPEWLSGDPIRLRQVLVNLVGNAIKFTEHGEVVVEVERNDSDAGEVELHFSVRDTGIGISEGKLDSIFDAFEQADASTTREYGGTGLGLAISGRIVEAMNGRIWVESVVGKGSTFHFTAVFPRATAPRDRADDFDPGELGRVPVLVVDDNDTNRRILHETLSSWGLPVQTVSAAGEALGALEDLAQRHEKLPLVLSDVNMPGMDGFELTEKLRENESLQQVPVILLTSGGRMGDVARCNELGVVAHLMKPVKQSELLDAIVEAVAVPGEQTEDRTAKEHSQRMQPLKILLAEDGKANRTLAIRLL